ncbi:hypothetical protein P7D93_08835, partial [Enterococcus raffinosus]|uniref:hypothetical protein n=1 Tax=Enterococcus raffinosus TaxID=71452 RepID=UPI002890136A
LWLKTLYRKRAVTWPFIFYTIIWTLSDLSVLELTKKDAKRVNSIFLFNNFEDFMNNGRLFRHTFKLMIL